MEDLIIFINDLATDLFYEKTFLLGKDLFQRGACYELFLIINSLEKDTTLYIHKYHNHVAIKHKNKLYDSTGEIENKEEYRPVTKDDMIYIDEYFGESYRHLNIKDKMLKELDKINIKEVIKRMNKAKEKVLS